MEITLFPFVHQIARIHQYICSIIKLLLFSYDYVVGIILDIVICLE